jgi:hypothetical protein
MKKTVALLSLAAFMLSAGVASANAEGKNERARVRQNVRAEVKTNFRKLLNFDRQNVFMVSGKIKSLGSNSLVITVDHSNKRDELAGKDVTVKTDSDTKYGMEGKSIAFTDLKVGFPVMVMGKKNDSDYVASRVHVKVEKKMLFGEVTAKTSNTVTIKNNVTGTTTTVPVDSNTKVNINGETKTLADVQVGDRGMVKVKTVLTTMVTKFLNLFR